MPLCTVLLTYEVYEGSLGQVPLPLCSWTVYINGLEDKQRRGMAKFFPELGETLGSSPTLTYAQSDKTRTYLNMSTTMAILTKYLNFLDAEGYRVVGHCCDSSVYSGGVTKTVMYTMQIGNGGCSGSGSGGGDLASGGS
ncbi:hypothetical protein Fcan01_04155 [Folsomia candida]|uniref:Uncharacterized protein n=1 Tax=Folsomia candida TaxID=158441 RepID=A0A226ESN7_FOLCA|nr:hypothetical protein Fcan01_04155 [Folsomia candida]